MANSVHVVYHLDDETKSKVVADGGELPQVQEIWDGALDAYKERGFVRCNPDGTPFEEPKPAPTGGGKTTGPGPGEGGN